MKKLLSLLCALGLFIGTFAVVGCSESKKETKSTTTTTSTGGDKEKKPDGK